MSRNTDNQILTWLDEIREEIEINFYGIAFALIFFFIVYLFFDPPWMSPLINYFY
jgi:Na+/H+ antiporter NhaC